MQPNLALKNHTTNWTHPSFYEKKSVEYMTKGYIYEYMTKEYMTNARSSWTLNDEKLISRV